MGHNLQLQLLFSRTWNESDSNLELHCNIMPRTPVIAVPTVLFASHGLETMTFCLCWLAITMFYWLRTRAVESEFRWYFPWRRHKMKKILAGVGVGDCKNSSDSDSNYSTLYDVKCFQRSLRIANSKYSRIYMYQPSLLLVTLLINLHILLVNCNSVA